MFITNPLKLMQKMLEENYRQYISGEITQKEYLVRVKPIDKEIGRLEMATLQGTLAWRGSSLQHALKPKQ